MTFEEYTKEALALAHYDKTSNVIYPIAGLASESGEALDEVKKALRDGIPLILSDKRRDNIFLELGDVLWYWVASCRDLGFDPYLVMQANIDKLQKRYSNYTSDKDYTS